MTVRKENALDRRVVKELQKGSKIRGRTRWHELENFIDMKFQIVYQISKRVATSFGKGNSRNGTASGSYRVARYSLGLSTDRQQQIALRQP
jgi:hypothetical protein